VQAYACWQAMTLSPFRSDNVFSHDVLDQLLSYVDCRCASALEISCKQLSVLVGSEHEFWKLCSRRLLGSNVCDLRFSVAGAISGSHCRDVRFWKSLVRNSSLEIKWLAECMRTISAARRRLLYCIHTTVPDTRALAIWPPLPGVQVRIEQEAIFSHKDHGVAQVELVGELCNLYKGHSLFMQSIHSVDPWLHQHKQVMVGRFVGYPALPTRYSQLRHQFEVPSASLLARPETGEADINDVMSLLSTLPPNLRGMLFSIDLSLPLFECASVDDLEVELRAAEEETGTKVAWTPHLYDDDWYKDGQGYGQVTIVGPLVCLYVCHLRLLKLIEPFI
jgi:hypothetical protein